MRRSRLYVLFFLATVVLETFAASKNHQPVSRDLSIIKSRLIETIRMEGVSGILPNGQPSDSTDTFRPIGIDGKWDDIGFMDEKQLARSLQLSYLYHEKGRFHRWKDLKETVNRALSHWIKDDPICSNWWFNEIGFPNYVYKIVLLMENDLNPEVKAGCMKILERSRIKMTGQNLMWLAQICIARGCLQNDTAIVSKAFTAIQKELTDTLSEGICPDFSFHQHGPLIYNGGYGKGFALYAARLVYLAHGTGFAFTKEKSELICKYLLEGEQWMMVGNAFDFSVIGREITRPWNSTGVNSMYQACAYMIDQNSKQKKALIDFKNRLKEAFSTVNFAPNGNRYYWCSDYMVHRRKGYFFSVHNSSTRVLGTECINGEGLQSYYLGDGCTNLQLTGKEYDAIFPVWNWKRLPGVTTPYNDDVVPVVTGYRTSRFYGGSSFVGGLSDGRYGMSVLEVKKDSVRARKSWFCFDREIVCLGAGLCSLLELPLFTSVNQCFLFDNVCVESKGGVLSLAENSDTTIEKANWVHHANTLYLFPDQAVIRLKNQEQQGSWSRITGGDSTVIRKKVFFLGLLHQKTSSNTYSYVIMPNVKSQDACTVAGQHTVQVLRNDTAVQGVYHPALQAVQAVFYRAETMILPNGMTVDVDRPCLLMLRKKGSAYFLSVSDPKMKPGTVRVGVGGKRRGCFYLRGKGRNNRMVASVRMPEGRKAGSTVTVRL